MAIVLIILAIALGPPALLALIAFVLSFVWPQRWEPVAQALSAVPILAYATLLSFTLLTEPDNQGDHVAAVQGIFLLPVLAAYLGILWGGAFSGRWLRRLIAPGPSR